MEVKGFIFMCSNETYKECVGRQLFGMPKQHLQTVKLIKKGTILFLYNFQSKTLSGVFEAQGSGSFMINKDAWRTSEGNNKSETPYPAQVGVRQILDCQPLQEEEFMAILKTRAARKRFRHRLNINQLQALVKLFGKKIQGRNPCPESLKQLMESQNNSTHQYLPLQENVSHSNNKESSGGHQQQQIAALQKNLSEICQHNKVLQQKVDTLHQRMEMLQNVNVDQQRDMERVLRKVSLLESQQEEFKTILGKRLSSQVDGECVAEDNVYEPQNNTVIVQYENQPAAGFGNYQQNAEQSGYNGQQPDGFGGQDSQQHVSDKDLVQVDHYSFGADGLEDCMKSMKISSGATP